MLPFATGMATGIVQEEIHDRVKDGAKTLLFGPSDEKSLTDVYHLLEKVLNQLEKLNESSDSPDDYHIGRIDPNGISLELRGHPHVSFLNQNAFSLTLEEIGGLRVTKTVNPGWVQIDAREESRLYTSDGSVQVVQFRFSDKPLGTPF